jgi:hypothetical protein
MKKPETLAKIAIAISVVALAVAIIGAVGRCGKQPRHPGLRGDEHAQRGEFRQGNPKQRPNDGAKRPSDGQRPEKPQEKQEAKK